MNTLVRSRIFCYPCECTGLIGKICIFFSILCLLYLHTVPVVQAHENIVTSEVTVLKNPLQQLEQTVGTTLKALATEDWVTVDRMSGLISLSARQLSGEMTHLPAAKAERVSAYLKQIQQLANLLHTAGEESDIKRARTEVKKLQGMVMLLKAQI